MLASSQQNQACSPGEKHGIRYVLTKTYLHLQEYRHDVEGCYMFVHMTFGRPTSVTQPPRKTIACAHKNSVYSFPPCSVGWEVGV